MRLLAFSRVRHFWLNIEEHCLYSATESLRCGCLSAVKMGVCVLQSLDNAKVKESVLCFAPSTWALFTFQLCDGYYHLLWCNNHQLPLPLLPFGSCTRSELCLLFTQAWMLRNSKVMHQDSEKCNMHELSYRFQFMREFSIQSTGLLAWQSRLVESSQEGPSVVSH